MSERADFTVKNWRWWITLPIFVLLWCVALTQAAIYYTGAAIYWIATWQSPFHNPAPNLIVRLKQWVFEGKKAGKRREAGRYERR